MTWRACGTVWSQYPRQGLAMRTGTPATTSTSLTAEVHLKVRTGTSFLASSVTDETDE
jgi:hypothetical protein